MTAEEFRTAIARLGLSQIGASTLFGINPRTSRRWALGEQNIPQAVAIALKLMVQFKVNPSKFMGKR